MYALGILDNVMNNRDQFISMLRLTSFKLTNNKIIKV